VQPIYSIFVEAFFPALISSLILVFSDFGSNARSRPLFPVLRFFMGGSEDSLAFTSSLVLPFADNSSSWFFPGDLEVP
jgi:hypothetical protein